MLFWRYIFNVSVQEYPDCHLCTQMKRTKHTALYAGIRQIITSCCRWPSNIHAWSTCQTTQLHTQSHKVWFDISLSVALGIWSWSDSQTLSLNWIFMHLFSHTPVCLSRCCGVWHVSAQVDTGVIRLETSHDDCLPWLWIGGINFTETVTSLLLRPVQHWIIEKTKKKFMVWSNQNSI